MSGYGDSHDVPAQGDGVNSPRRLAIVDIACVAYPSFSPGFPDSPSHGDRHVVNTLRTALALSALLLSHAAQAQRPVAPRPATGTASVSGVVIDSLALKPLTGARVQLVNADSITSAARTVTTDSLGRYLFRNVHVGRYLVGFLHPMLDSLGIEPRQAEVSVDGSSASRIDLSIPSPLALRTAICGAKAVADSDALILGVVRTASDKAPVDSAIVSAQWVEMLLGAGRVNRSMAKRATRSSDAGWFAICGAPSNGAITLGATHAADSTEVLELEVPISGFVRRDLYFGTARVERFTAAGASADGVAPTVRLSGDGRLSGVVVSASGNRPLAGARVGIVRGPQTRADDSGAWTLTGVPTGTRMLEVRALAHYPITMPVDVVEGAAPVRVAMVTLESVLETVRISAQKNGTSGLLDFLARKRSGGAGRFITSEDIAVRNPLNTSDLLRGTAGVYLDIDASGQEIITMRGNGGAHCNPLIYLNRSPLRGLTNGELNNLLRPRDLIGIEVYTAATSPAMYQDQNGCGTLVLTTR